MAAKRREATGLQLELAAERSGDSVVEMADEVRKLRDERDGLKTALEEAVRASEEHRARADKMDAQFKRLQQTPTAIAIYDRKMAVARSEIARLKKQIADVTADRDTLREELARATLDDEQDVEPILRQQLDGLAEQDAYLRMLFEIGKEDDLVGAAHGLRHNLDTALKDIEQIRELFDVGDRRGTLEALQERRAHADATKEAISLLRDERDAARAEREQVQNQLDAETKRHMITKRLLEEVRADCDATRIARATLRARWETLPQDVREGTVTTQAAPDLTSQALAESEAELCQVKANRVVLRKKLEEAETRRAQAAHSASTAEQELSVALEQVKRLRAERTALRRVHYPARTDWPQQEEINRQAGTSPSRFWMLYHPAGSAPKFIHPSEAAARTEAERLASANPGELFYVLQATGCARHRAIDWTDEDLMEWLPGCCDPDEEIPF